MGLRHKTPCRRESRRPGLKLGTAPLQSDLCWLNQDQLGTQEVIHSLSSLPRDCPKEVLLEEMLKILLRYAGAQKGTFLVGEPIAGVQVSVDFNEKTKKFDVYVGAVDDNTWNRVPKTLVKKSCTLQQPTLLGSWTSIPKVEHSSERHPYEFERSLLLG